MTYFAGSDPAGGFSTLSVSRLAAVRPAQRSPRGHRLTAFAFDASIIIQRGRNLPAFQMQSAVHYARGPHTSGLGLH
ncbi:hypothetical protein [Nocardia pseudobrasiliensis]|uniref:hypothetical protein n=1 Tax=Nocardia pseudobrasiliensis TaxID=45979 RepID=UPI00082F0228|nr:hypothetical protein [Nocardia pseudobrasiliensis]